MNPVRHAHVAVLAALVAHGILRVAARYPEGVEAVYSNRLFPAISGALCAVARLSPVSLSEVLVSLLGVALGKLALQALLDGLRGHRRPRALLFCGSCRAVRCASWSYVAFLATWGFQHARQPYAFHAGLDVRPTDADELAALVAELVADCNRLRAELEPSTLALAAGADERLVRGYAALAQEVPAIDGGAPLLRRALFSPLLSRLGISGIYSPFTAEAHLNADMPLRAHAFAACHEVAHQRGFAREDEANFIAWQVCVRSGDPAFRYSASAAALTFAAGALAAVDHERTRAILADLSPAVVADGEESRRFWEAWRTVLTEVAIRTNDAYLRSQGQAAGVRSYGRMVDLMLAERRR